MGGPSKICPICKVPVPNFWRHLDEVHPDMDPKEYLRLYLGLPEIPRCPNCGNEVSIKWGCYKFTKTCSKSCGSSVGAAQSLIKWFAKGGEGPRAARAKAGKIRSIRMKGKETTFHKWAKKNPELAHQYAVNNGRRQFAKMIANKRGKWYPPSKVELYILDMVKSIFPDAISNYEIYIYAVDIYIPCLKVGIEVDGSAFHDLDKDIIRDKRIYDIEGIKIRRLDADYCWKITKEELMVAILTECIIKSPYWNRIPKSELMEWKCNCFKYGPSYLLT